MNANNLVLRQQVRTAEYMRAKFLAAVSKAAEVGAAAECVVFRRMAGYFEWRILQIELVAAGQRDTMPTFQEYNLLCAAESQLKLF